MAACISDHRYVHIQIECNDWQVAACMIAAMSIACRVVKAGNILT